MQEEKIEKQHKKASHNLSLIILMATAILFNTLCLGCGGSGGGDGGGGSGEQDGEGLTITGTVDATLTTESFLAAIGSNTTTSLGRGGVDQVWAVPLLTDGYGRFDPAMFSSANKKVFPLTNGHFSIEFEGHEDTDNWILLLVNSDADERSDTIVSYIAVSDLEEQLVQIPVGQMSGTLDIGNLTEHDEEEDEAVAEVDLEEFTSVCSLSYGQLQHLAKIDDTVKTIRNIWINTTYNDNGNATTYYQSSIHHHWHQSIANAENQFSYAADQYKGYGIELYFQDDRISWSDVMDPNTDVANFTPPDVVTINAFLLDTPGLTYGPGTPIVSNGPYNSAPSDAYDNDLGFCAWKDTFDVVRFQYASTVAHTSDGFGGQIPEGNWLLMNSTQTETYATFDFSMESPFNSNGTTKIYIPEIQINTDDQHEISLITIRWMLYNQTQQSYEMVTDLSGFWDSVSGVRMDLNFQAGDTWGSGWSVTNVDLLANETAEYTPEDTIYLNHRTENGSNLVWVAIHYKFNGATCIHNWATIHAD